MDDVEDVYTLDRIADCAIEYPVISMHAQTNSAVRIAGNEGEAERHVTQANALIP